MSALDPVRPGYKRTEIGVVPEDWQAKPIADVVDRVRLGGNYPNSGRETSRPLIKMGNMGRGNIELSKVQYVPESFPIDQQHRCCKGDVLFNTRNTLDLVGKVCVWRDELPIAYFNSNILRLEFSEREISSPYFANYALNSHRSILGLREIATGTTSVAAIYTRDLLDFKVAIPTLPEQRAIADALGDMDALIASLDSLITKKRDIKQAAMQQLLTGKTRLPGFERKKGYKQTELGVVPEDWEVQTVASFGHVVTGGTPSTKNRMYWNGEFPWVTPTDISASRDMFTSERCITAQGMKAIRSLPADTVLVTCIASIGKNAILKLSGACNQQINAIIPNGNHDAVFLYYVFESNKGYLLGKAGTTATSIISKAIFEGLIFPIPPAKAEQSAIATVLSDMDAALSALEAKREKTRALKQGMMQELLSGRMRLV
jgi:type I restriction enzyme, S subunit